MLPVVALTYRAPRFPAPAKDREGRVLSAVLQQLIRQAGLLGPAVGPAGSVRSRPAWRTTGVR
jgi:hypothetical protein